METETLRTPDSVRLHDRLTAENFGRGFLIDEELMAGVTAPTEEGSPFSAYVLRHTTGEYLGLREFTNLDQALAAINAIPRDWIYEASGGCGEGACGEGGGCAGGNCGTEQCPGVCG